MSITSHETNTVNASASDRKDLYQTVTDTIVQQLKADTVPWHKPWQVGQEISFTIPKNFTTGTFYRGVNILLLWSATLNKQYTSHDWASLKQWNAKKESIRKDEKGSLIVFYDTKEVEDKDGETKKIPFIKSYKVFNRCQLKSFNSEEQQPLLPQEPLVKRLEYAEAFIANTKATITYEGARACYRSTQDDILMPHPLAFMDTETSTATENFFATLSHELVHWSGHSTRLDRKLKNRFGLELYAQEELVAELGASFLCAALQISNEPRPDHANYIASWLKAMKEDKYAITQAASVASKAVDYLFSLQPLN